MFKIQSSFKISENVGGDHPTPTKLNWKVVEVHCPANMLLLKFLFIYFKIGEGDETIRVWIFIVWEFFFLRNYKRKGNPNNNNMINTIRIQITLEKNEYLNFKSTHWDSITEI